MGRSVAAAERPFSRLDFTEIFVLSRLQQHPRPDFADGVSLSRGSKGRIFRASPSKSDLCATSHTKRTAACVSYGRHLSPRATKEQQHEESHNTTGGYCHRRRSVRFGICRRVLRKSGQARQGWQSLRKMRREGVLQGSCRQSSESRRDQGVQGLRGKREEVNRLFHAARLTGAGPLSAGTDACR